MTTITTTMTADEMIDRFCAAAAEALRSTRQGEESADAAVRVSEEAFIDGLLMFVGQVLEPSRETVERMAIEMYGVGDPMSGGRLTSFSELSAGTRDGWRRCAKDALTHLARQFEKAVAS